MKKVSLRNALNLSHFFIQEIVQKGDFVLDATCGNGNDTLFLAQLVGGKGMVYAFDIQEEAIKISRRLLCSEKLINRVTLIRDDHSNIKEYINKPIKAAMYNLGKINEEDISTKVENTIKSLTMVLGILQTKGIITLVVYPESEEGKSELMYLQQYLEKLDQKQFSVIQTSFINQKNDSPSLFILQKL